MAFFTCLRNMDKYLSKIIAWAWPTLQLMQFLVLLFSDVAVVEATFGGAVAAAGEFEDVAGFLDVVSPVELETEFRAGESYLVFGQAEFQFIAADGIA